MHDENRDNWNLHKWRRETGWWDDLEVDKVQIERDYASVFEWLELKGPTPYEHDYILHTDGSGCTEGWGGYAALWQRIELDGEFRSPVSSGTIVTGTYGSTVQRAEFSAFLDGVHAILTERAKEVKSQAVSGEYGDVLYDIGSKGGLSPFTGPDRITILWYTDRSNLAQALLHDTDSVPLQARSNERDLWMRWSYMAKHVCVTPMCKPRNTIPMQAACDALAGEARTRMLSALETFTKTTEQFHNPESWKKKKSQTAAF